MKVRDCCCACLHDGDVTPGSHNTRLIVRQYAFLYSPPPLPVMPLATRLAVRCPF